MLATQSIKARVRQRGCIQAYTIGLSINEDLKLRKGKGERKTGGSMAGLYKYLKRAAKTLVVSDPIVMWQNIAEFGR